jgi:hypothetical protein
MILNLTRDPQRGWEGTIENDGVVVVRSRLPEPRIGCAIRTLLNTLQHQYGQPDMQSITINLENW